MFTSNDKNKKTKRLGLNEFAEKHADKRCDGSKMVGGYRRRRYRHTISIHQLEGLEYVRIGYWQ